MRKLQCSFRCFTINRCKALFVRALQACSSRQSPAAYREEGREAFVCFGIPLMRNLCRLGQDFVAPLCNTAAHMPDHLLKCLHEHLTLSPVECATAHAETQALDHLGNRTCNKGKEYIQKCDPPGPSVCFLWKGLQKVSTGQTPHSSRRCPKVSSWWDRRRNHMFFNLVSKRLQ